LLFSFLFSYLCFFPSLSFFFSFPLFISPFPLPLLSFNFHSTSMISDI
jgi:hypothetical protein